MKSYQREFQQHKDMPINFQKEIWCVGGGKGGVGKSVITMNLAIILSQRGYKILLIDADFGAANVHTLLGESFPKRSLSEYLINDVPLNELVTSTRIPNLSIIGGARDSLRVSNPPLEKCRALMSDLEKLNFDIALIDLGAGTVNHTIEIFANAHKRILVTMPEATSIENTYRFIKYAFYRNLNMMVRSEEIKSYLDHLINRHDNEHLTPMILMENMQRIDPAEAERIKMELYGYSMRLVINQVRTNNDVRLGFSMSTTCQKYFGFRLDYVGFVENDEAIYSSSKNRSPLYLDDSFSKSARGIRKISENLMNNEHVVTALI